MSVGVTGAMWENSLIRDAYSIQETLTYGYSDSRSQIA